MRKKSKRKDRDGEGEGEKDLERQLKKTTREKEGGTRIMVASTSKVTDRATHESGGAHINFWEEFENGVSFIHLARAV